MPQRSAANTPRSVRPARVLAVCGIAALLMTVLGGCLRVQTSMGVSSDDRVSGRVVVAVLPEHPGDKGPQLQIPSALAGKVRVQPYHQDGYVGNEVYFDNLAFGEVSQLSQLAPQTQGMLDLHFRRNGDLVTLDGRADLQSVPPHGSDVQLNVAFPVRVAKTDGTRTGDSVVTWKLPAGEVSTIHAEVGYPDPNTRSFAGWAGIIGGITLAVAAVVIAMAFLDRNPPAAGAPEGFSIRRWWALVRDPGQAQRRNTPSAGPMTHDPGPAGPPPHPSDPPQPSGPPDQTRTGAGRTS